MPFPPDAIPALFAQAAAPAANPNAGILNLMPIILVVGLWFYILILRPQQKQEKQRKDLLAALKKNDRVLLTAGIYGTVVNVDADQDRVTVRVDDDKGIRLVVTKASVARILDGGDEKAKDKDKDRPAKERAAETA